MLQLMSVVHVGETMVFRPLSIISLKPCGSEHALVSKQSPTVATLG